MSLVTRAAPSGEEIGTCCLVLHTHLPWVAHAGAWPVGEEWLHQAFTSSWRRVIDVCQRLAAEGRRDLLTLGITPTVAAMLDDPYCLTQIHQWTGNWILRAEELASSSDHHLRELAHFEQAAARDCLINIEDRWLYGGSPILRRLSEDSVLELLGGPVAHPFLPLLDDRLVAHTLRTGSDDARLRWGTRPVGIWSPECGYRPGLEQIFAAQGIGHLLVDGPALKGRTSQVHPIGATDVVCFGRDLEVTYRVWSPKSGYPGKAAYRDFHTFDHASGFRPARVTSRRIPPQDKAPWDPVAAQAQARRDAVDFVDVVRRRLVDLAAETGRRAITVAAFDTELFGHWWYEGPVWLEQVLRLLPLAGVRVTTLRAAAQAGHVGAPVELPASSWGTGKDWRVWAGPQVADIVDAAETLGKQLLSTVDARPTTLRDRRLDQLCREAYLALASDWAFMVSKNSAADYARSRIATHSARFERLRQALDTDPVRAAQVAAECARVDGPWGHLDARLL
ncbi:glycoside hydrolase family 57 protein [soil metagenome]